MYVLMHLSVAMHVRPGFEALTSRIIYGRLLYLPYCVSKLTHEQWYADLCKIVTRWGRH